MFLLIWFLSVSLEAVAVSLPHSRTNGLLVQSAESSWLRGSQHSSEEENFKLPMFDADQLGRAYEIGQKRRGYLYGKSLLGNTSYFPTGFLGEAMVQQHQRDWYNDSTEVVNLVNEESAATAAALEKVIRCLNRSFEHKIGTSANVD